MTDLVAQLLTISVLSLQRQLYHNRDLHLNDNSVWWNASYDFVIVGAGSAGCVLAARLSENPAVSVLLIEAGGPQTVITDIMNSQPFENDTARIFYSVPQQYSSSAYTDRQVYYPRGRILGGSSSINDAAYNRGNAHVYDDWSRVYGAPGWTYREVLPYFLLSENQTDPAVLARDPQYHAVGGPLQVSTIPNLDPIFLRWTEAVHAAGWPITDFNGPSQYGTNIVQTTQFSSNWTRASTASAYIEPIRTRPNLHILLYSVATKILFNQSSQRPEASGVEFIGKDNQTYRVTARRELIISCGVFQSPQLLMLSGIGPRDHLTQLGIPVLADLPVGNNLHDHVIVMLDAFARNHSEITFGSTLYYSFTPDNLYQLMVNNYGPLTRDPTSITYISTGINGDRDFPDIVMYFQVSVINPNLTEAVEQYDESHREEWRKFTEPLAGIRHHIELNFNNFRPRSRGTLRLSAADPFADLLIDPKLYSDPRDLAAVIRGMQIGLKLAESPAMKPHLDIYHQQVPGCSFCSIGPQVECLSYLRCVAQTVTGSTGHHVGTCRMGNSTSPDAVVDERLRVLGVARLRVADASIMPQVPNANPNAAVIMIAERANDFIRQDNRLLF